VGVGGGVGVAVGPGSAVVEAAGGKVVGAAASGPAEETRGMLAVPPDGDGSIVASGGASDGALWQPKMTQPSMISAVTARSLALFVMYGSAPPRRSAFRDLCVWRLSPFS